jgi:hypothetical protein
MTGQPTADEDRAAGSSFMPGVGAAILAVIGIFGRWLPVELWDRIEARWRPDREQARGGRPVFKRVERISTAVLWACAALIPIILIYLLSEAHFDLLRVNWAIIIPTAAAVGVWCAFRDGRGPVWRLAILLLWAAILASWLGLAAAIASATEHAIAGGFARPHQWTLAALAGVALLAVRGSAWVYAMLITEWQHNPITGERHRVLSRSQGEVLLDHRTWLQRRNEEMIERRERRKRLMPQAVILAGCAAAALYAWANLYALSLFYSGALLFGAFSGASLLVTGYQGMKGAKVFDRKPKPKAPPFGAPPEPTIEGEEEHSGRRIA